jgi:hypothetical protein
MLDDYPAHKTQEVRTQLQTLGITVFFLPPGTTHHIQVLDVGINKPFKSYLRKETISWITQNPNPSSKRGRKEIS